MAFWTLTFDEPAPGPLSIGALSCFGLGRFAPGRSAAPATGLETRPPPVLCRTERVSEIDERCRPQDEDRRRGRQPS